MAGFLRSVGGGGSRRRGLQTVNGSSRGRSSRQIGSFSFGGGGAAPKSQAFQPTQFQPQKSNVNQDFVQSQLALQRQMSERAAAAADPWAQQRGQYQTALNSLMQGGQSAIGQDPSVNFRFRKGQQAVESSAASQGLLGSGRAALELQQYGQEFASTEYQNQYERLQNLAGVNAGSPVAAAQILQQSGQFGVDTAMGLRQQDIGQEQFHQGQRQQAHQGQQSLAFRAHEGQQTRQQQSSQFDREFGLRQQQQGLREQESQQQNQLQRDDPRRRLQGMVADEASNLSRQSQGHTPGRGYASPELIRSGINLGNLTSSLRSFG